jgi:antitoxin (DNA-binding transcriptional repressor) of toxin-antitoxin stability system
LRAEGCELDRAALAVGDLQPVQAGERVVQAGELIAHLVPERGGERGWVERLVELVVVLDASDLKIGG